MRTIVSLSGLGADYRLLQKLEVRRCKFQVLAWEMPGDEETIRAYAHRMASRIDHEGCTLLGVSFGGVVALEIASICHAKHVILLSSMRSPAGISPCQRFLMRHMPASFYTVLRFGGIGPLADFFFGIEKPEESYLLRSMVANTDPKFAAWALRGLATWEGVDIQTPIDQIHGTADRILLPTFSSPDWWILGGGHFMVYNRSKQISALLESILHRSNDRMRFT